MWLEKSTYVTMCLAYQLQYANGTFFASIRSWKVFYISTRIFLYDVFITGALDTMEVLNFLIARSAWCTINTSNFNSRSSSIILFMWIWVQQSKVRYKNHPTQLYIQQSGKSSEWGLGAKLAFRCLYAAAHPTLV